MVAWVDAQRWLDEVSSLVLTGAYVDPDAGKVTFAARWTVWSARQTWAHSTRDTADLSARSVTFAGLRLGEAAAIQASDIETTSHVLAVRRQVQGEVRGKQHIVPPKAGSERDVPIPTSVHLATPVPQSPSTPTATCGPPRMTAPERPRPS